MTHDEATDEASDACSDKPTHSPHVGQLAVETNQEQACPGVSHLERWMRLRDAMCSSLRRRKSRLAHDEEKKVTGSSGRIWTCMFPSSHRHTRSPAAENGCCGERVLVFIAASLQWRIACTIISSQNARKREHESTSGDCHGHGRPLTTSR